MNLEASILAEHSRAQCMRIVDYIGNNKERFARLAGLPEQGQKITESLK